MSGWRTDSHRVVTRGIKLALVLCMAAAGAAGPARAATVEEQPGPTAEETAPPAAAEPDAVETYVARLLRATARANRGRRLKRLLRTGSLGIRLPGTEEVRGTLRIQVSFLPASGGRAIRLARLRTRAPIGSRTEGVKLSKRGKRRLARLWVAALEFDATLVPDEGEAVHDRRVILVRR